MWHCCLFPNKNIQLRDIFMKPIFPAGQADFVPIPLQPEICSALSADPASLFPAPSPKYQWHANEFHMQMSSSVTGNKTIQLFQFYVSRKTRHPHYICYLLSKASIKHPVARSRITHTSWIVSQYHFIN